MLSNNEKILANGMSIHMRSLCSCGIFDDIAIPKNMKEKSSDYRIDVKGDV